MVETQNKRINSIIDHNIKVRLVSSIGIWVRRGGGEEGRYEVGKDKEEEEEKEEKTKNFLECYL